MTRFFDARHDSTGPYESNPLVSTAATIALIPAGRLGDRTSPTVVLTAGVVMLRAAYAGFAAGPPSVFLGLLTFFVAAGVAIGGVETAEHAAVANNLANELRGSGFGLLAGVQSFGNIAASRVTGILWTVFSQTVAFTYPVTWKALAVVVLILRSRRPARRTSG